MSEVKLVSVLPAFAGSATKVVPWLAQYRAQVQAGCAAEANDAVVSLACKAKFAQFCSPAAWEVLSANGTIEKAWADMVTDLKSLYLPADASGSALTELQGRRQRQEESVMSFFEAYVVLVKDAGQTMEDWKGHFAQALRPELFSAISLHDMGSMPKVLTLATKAERALKLTGRPEALQPAPTSLIEEDEIVAAAFERGRREGARMRSKEGVDTRHEEGLETRRCYNCQQVGHLKRNCPARGKRGKPVLASVSSKYSTTTTAKNGERRAEVMICSGASGPTVLFNLGGVPCPSVIDSGSARSLISADFAASNGWRRQRDAKVSLISATRRLPSNGGALSAQFIARAQAFETELLIVTGLVVSVLLGRDFVNRHRLVIDIARQRLHMRG